MQLSLPVEVLQLHAAYHPTVLRSVAIVFVDEIRTHSQRRVTLDGGEHVFSSIEFRAETFNTFNHAQPNGTNNTFGDANMGQVTSYYDPRAVEFGGKFIF